MGEKACSRQVFVWVIVVLTSTVIALGGCSRRLPVEIAKDAALTAATAVVEEVIDKEIARLPQGHARQALLGVRALLQVKEKQDRLGWILNPVQQGLQKGGGKRLAREIAQAVVKRFVSEKVENEVKKQFTPRRTSTTSSVGWLRRRLDEKGQVAGRSGQR
jgi:hypothetical protein